MQGVQCRIRQFDTKSQEVQQWMNNLHTLCYILFGILISELWPYQTFSASNWRAVGLIPASDGLLFLFFFACHEFVL